MTQQDDRRPIPLETFAGVQDLEGRVDIVAGEDGRPQVIAAGRTASGLKVEWLQPGAATPAEGRVVQRFLDSLSEEYGARITRAIAAELGLEQSGASLDTRLVKDALRMAETQKEVFTGANFFVELHCSAKARTPAFRAACAAAGLDAGALTGAELAEIDERFRRAADDASRHDREPLSTEDGERVLAAVVSEWATGRAAR
jgi:hypothetical protein